MDYDIEEEIVFHKLVEFIEKHDSNIKIDNWKKFKKTDVNLYKLFDFYYYLNEDDISYFNIENAVVPDVFKRLGTEYLSIYTSDIEYINLCKY